jgi:egghead protein (zeste-white 4 protein)
MTPIAVFWYCVLFLWATYLPYGSQFLYNFLRYRKNFTFKPSGAAPAVSDHIVFQITTTSVTENAHLLNETVERVKEACTALKFTNFSIRTLSDDPRDFSNPFCVDRVMVTPSEYDTDAIKKGRSMQYAVETYRSEPGDKSKAWIFHLDEESVMLPQTLEAVLTFIASGKGTLAEGPIFYPSVFSGNPITRIADAIRSATCYFCVRTMSSGKAPSHIHGSNLLVRMDVECEVGWALGKTIAEDQLFGLKVFEKYPQMGWHGGIVLGQHRSLHLAH